jgi:predicted metal-binding protein
MIVTETAQPNLFICTTCRAGEALAEGDPPRGLRLHAALEALLAEAPAPVALRTVTCLANCERGCSAAIAMPGKWTNLLGFLHPDHAADLLAYAAAYAASPTGTVMPSRRPAALHRMVVGRVPHLMDAAA